MNLVSIPFENLRDSFEDVCVIHLSIAGYYYLTAFILGAAASVVLSRRQPWLAARRIFRMGTFLTLLLLAGSCFDCLWYCTIYDRLYCGCRYVNFMPFRPITYDEICGDPKGLLMTPFLGVQLVWGTFAISTWLVAILAYRLFMAGVARLTPPAKVFPATP